MMNSGRQHPCCLSRSAASMSLCQGRQRQCRLSLVDAEFCSCRCRILLVSTVGVSSSTSFSLGATNLPYLGCRCLSSFGCQLSCCYHPLAVAVVGCCRRWLWWLEKPVPDSRRLSTSLMRFRCQTVGEKSNIHQTIGC